jgi:hypothetical protein
MDIENDVTLLMTATIDPKGMPSAATMPDPDQRQSDYAKALSYYLHDHTAIRRIVFAENSGWPLDNLKKVASDQATGQEVEFLSFALNDFPREWGKSYGEMLLMDHAFAESRLIAQSRYVAKVTGRIIVQNVTAMLHRAPDSFDFYADLRDHPLYEWVGSLCSGHHGESRFFLLTPEFYNARFKGKYLLLKENEGILLETLIYQTVKQLMPGGRVIGRFRNEPQYRGIAGHHGKNYSSARERAKQFVRSSSRRVLPWLWI